MILVRSQNVILFDGVCNLCNFFINFVIDRDDQKHFKFASLQSEIAHEFLSESNQVSHNLESVVLVEGGSIYTKSDAALRILKKIGFPWVLFYPFIIIPKFIRDWVYDWVAKNRYKWFGKSEVCRIPNPDILERFLDS